MTYYDILLELRGFSYVDWKNGLLKHKETAEIVNMLENVPQALFWHPEFEVLKHVYLVYTSICRQGTLELLETALLHDTGKATTTNIGKDKMYSFGHEDDSLIFIEKNKHLIKYYEVTKRHMQVKEVSDKQIANDFMMKEFVKADKTMSKVLYYEFFFQEDEQNKIKEAEVLAKQQNASTKVYVTVGISGSGKSTYLKTHFKPEVIVCPDQIRKELTHNISDQSKNGEVWPITKQRMLDVLKKHGEVVLDATNVNKSLRIRFMSAFNYNKKIALVFNTPIDICKARVSDDIANKVDRSNVPMNIIDKQYTQFNNGKESLQHEFNEIQEII